MCDCLLLRFSFIVHACLFFFFSLDSVRVCWAKRVTACVHEWWRVSEKEYMVHEAVERLLNTHPQSINWTSTQNHTLNARIMSFSSCNVFSLCVWIHNHKRVCNWISLFLSQFQILYDYVFLEKKKPTDWKMKYDTPNDENLNANFKNLPLVCVPYTKWFRES